MTTRVQASSRTLPGTDYFGIYIVICLAVGLETATTVSSDNLSTTGGDEFSEFCMYVRQNYNDQQSILKLI